MIVLSFKSKNGMEKTIEKAKKIEEYAAELVECLEEAKEQYDDWEDDYSERNYRGSTNMRSGRYSYRR